MLARPSPTIFTISMRKMSISPPELEMWNSAKWHEKSGSASMAFDRSIGTSIVAVASRNSKAARCLRGKTRAQKIWQTRNRHILTFWNTSVEGWPSIAMAYFGRDVHLPLIALDLGSQLSSTISLTHIQSGRPGSENPDALGSNVRGTIGMSLHGDTTSNRCWWSESQPWVAWLQSSPWWPWYKMQGLHFNHEPTYQH